MSIFRKSKERRKPYTIIRHETLPGKFRVMKGKKCVYVISEFRRVSDLVDYANFITEHRIEPSEPMEVWQQKRAKIQAMIDERRERARWVGAVKQDEAA